MGSLALASAAAHGVCCLFVSSVCYLQYKIVLFVLFSVLFQCCFDSQVHSMFNTSMFHMFPTSSSTSSTMLMPPRMQVPLQHGLVPHKRLFPPCTSQFLQGLLLPCEGRDRPHPLLGGGYSLYRAIHFVFKPLYSNGTPQVVAT